MSEEKNGEKSWKILHECHPGRAGLSGSLSGINTVILKRFKCVHWCLTRPEKAIRFPGVELQTVAGLPCGC